MFAEIPDAKGHTPKQTVSNVNEVFKPNKSRSKSHFVVAPPPPPLEDDDGQPSSSAEDYDDDSLDPHNNVFTKPTRTSSQNSYHHIHNNNARYNNVPLFGPGSGGSAVSNGGIVTHTEVRGGSDNEVPTGMGSTSSHNCYSCCCYKLFPINLFVLVLFRLIS